MRRRIGVFCAAGEGLDAAWYEAGRQFGRALAEAGFDLVYGASDAGVMGAVAQGVRAGGGRVTGVIPEKLSAADIRTTLCDELIVTPDLRARMARMDALSDGFCALPGGFGTLYELFEVLTLNNLGYERKPVVLLNARGYFDDLARLFARMHAWGFAPREARGNYRFADTPRGAVDALREALGRRSGGAEE